MSCIPSFAAGDEDEDESGEERLPSCFDYVMHFLTVFWKVLFACVPPTEYCNGWACFIVSIMIIGMLTAVIGDLASHFGCTIGLKDSVTAVVFVAFGTSVPGEEAYGELHYVLLHHSQSHYSELKGVNLSCPLPFIYFAKKIPNTFILLPSGMTQELLL